MKSSANHRKIRLGGNPMLGIRQILENYPRLTYFVPFISLTVSLLVFPRPNLLYTDMDSTRYMLSTIVQSEASIVAIVITLSIVAVQVTASSYSSRVTEIFRDRFDLWVMMALYIFAIGFGIAVLKMIEVDSKGTFVFDPEQQTTVLKIIKVNSNPGLEKWISFSYFLGIFCFSALIPYTYNMLTTLKPSTIIRILSEKINKDGVLQGDPIQPVIDIVRSSMMKYDYEAARDGLREVGYKICNILNEEEPEKHKNLISEKVFLHFSRVGKLAVGRKDEDSAAEVIENIKKIGEVILDKEHIQ